MERTTALLDACALYSAPLRDLLLTLADDDFYTPRWTEQIQDEWSRAFLRNNPAASQDLLCKTQAQMNLVFPHGLVTGHEHLIETMALPDANDRHVLAAAITGRVQIIVTFNLTDFPAAQLSRFHLKAQHPDDFLVAQMESAPDLALIAAESILRKLTRPPYTRAQYLNRLKQVQLPNTAAFLNYHGFLGV